MSFDLAQLNNYREGNRLEAKKAKGGLPDSLWETYSSFANSNGGVILLGVEEAKDKSFIVRGVDDADKFKKQIWDNLNNPQKVSANILVDKDVAIEEAGGLDIIRIDVPRADRHMRPVYIGSDPFKGTFRRDGEGDYHCTRDEIRNMFRDAANESQDRRILVKFKTDDLNVDTLRKYRTKFKSDRPDHPWADMPDETFLRSIGALGEDDSGIFHPTAAGLLMFGEDWRITDEFPHYFLDYQENDGSNDRWTDRFISSSGDWSGNLYDFYLRVSLRLDEIVRVPFKLNEESIRIDRLPVHDALREAIANTLSNANYQERGGLVIKRTTNSVTLRNPGAFRIPLEEALQGGFSDPRNETILKMFNFIGVGERAGSGIPNIFHVWRENKWPEPQYEEKFKPERAILELQLIPVSDANPSVNPSVNPSIKQHGLTEKERSVINIIAGDGKITAGEIAELLSISRSTVSDRIQTLKKKGILRRVGPDKGGYWEIVGDNPCNESSQA